MSRYEYEIEFRRPESIEGWEPYGVLYTSLREARGEARFLAEFPRWRGCEFRILRRQVGKWEVVE